MSETTRKYPTWRKIARIGAITITSILLLVVLLVLLIHTPPVQNLLRSKVVSYLENKLQTKVEIGKVRFVLPRRLVLEDIYMEDQQKDTLLAGGLIRANVNFFGLLSNELEVREMFLKDITAKVRRVLPDTSFNFQFVVDAFTMEKNKDSDTAETAPLKLSLDNLELENISVIYRDVITGDDMNVRLASLAARIDSLDPYEQRYSIPSLDVEGLTMRFSQFKPLVESEPESKDMAEAALPITMDIDFDQVNLKRIDIKYENSVSDFYTDLVIGNLSANAERVDLEERILWFESLHLDNSNAAIRLGDRDEARVIEQEIEKEVAVQSRFPWSFRIREARINNQSLAYENANAPRQSYGIDYGHLDADSLFLHVNEFVLNADSIGGNITQGSFAEQSGFRLQALKGEVLYASTKSYLKDLYIKTPGSEIKRYAELTYDSYQDLARHFEDSYIEADIDDSYIQVKDILAFAPQLRREAAFRNPNATWYLDFQGEGTLASMRINNLQFRGLKDTRIDARGTLAALGDENQTGGTLYIRQFHTSQSDIALFTGSRLTTPEVYLPETFDANGTISGTLVNMRANLSIRSSVGTVSINGVFGQLARPAQTTYTAAVQTSGLQLGRILRNEQLGNLSTSIKLVGSGLTPETMNARFNGRVNSFYLNDYTYRNANIKGTYARNTLNMDLDMNDPNLAVDGKLYAVFSEPMVLRFNGMIDSLKAKPLGISNEHLVIRGRVDANIPYLGKDFLEADIKITDGFFVTAKQRLSLDLVQLSASRNGDRQRISLVSDVARGEIEGRYNYNQLGNIFINAIDPYFSLVEGNPADAGDHDVNFKLDVYNTPLISALIPALGDFETIHAEGSVVSGQGLNMTVQTPSINFQGNQFSGLNLAVNTTNEGLKLNGRFDRLQGKGMDLYKTDITATALNNQVSFDLRTKDIAETDRYVLAGNLVQPSNGVYRISLKPGSVLLNYQEWTVAPNNSITISPTQIKADNFRLYRGEESISLQSIGEQLQVNVKDFQISTITAFLNQDSLMANGSMTGVINFRNIMKQPVFTSDLVVEDLSFKGDTVGTASIKVDNLSGDIYRTNATITGRGNDISLTGSFRPAEGNDVALDLLLDIRAMQLSTMEGAFGGFLKNASGAISGKVQVGGSINQPRISGPLKFDKASFAISILGSQFRVDGEEIQISENGFFFDEFVIRDSANNELILHGMVQTTNFTNYLFDLNVSADNFQLLNSTKKDNQIYYGDLVISAGLHVDGTEKSPIIDGNVTINDGTNLTVVIPQREPGVIDRQGVVQFVDFDDPVQQNLFAQYDSLNYAGIEGMNVSVNIEILKEALFHIVIDEANGDFIDVQGEAQLSTGIDPSGKVTLVGNYELEKGAYEITFNFLHRRFDIVKGSSITWLDQPTNARLDVRAVYIANTSPIDLVQSQIRASQGAISNTYRQKLPFEVHLHLTGELLKPEVSFDIRLPTDKSYGVSNDILIQVQSRLTQLRQDQGEINKQVFALLLLNRFVGPNPFDSETSGFSASQFARQSVSKLLTSQLNKLAAGLIDGVDINFDVTSSDDYTTGERRSRTDLNMSVTKQLLNERLSVSVGSNFALQGQRNSNQKASNIIGDLSVNYMLSRDGRYMLRFFRRNQYEGVLDGYVIETGLSFLLSMDYDKLSELLKKKSKKRVEGVSE